jgi:hypothetical protein
MTPSPPPTNLVFRTELTSRSGVYVEVVIRPCGDCKGGAFAVAMRAVGVHRIAYDVCHGSWSGALAWAKQTIYRGELALVDSWSERARA